MNSSKLKGIIYTGLIQIASCFIVYKFNIPNPNIVLFVQLSAVLVQYGYFAGIVSGFITLLYSAFFFSTDHSMIIYEPINRNKMIIIALGIVLNIVIIGGLQKVNFAAQEKIARLEAEKKQRKKIEVLRDMTIALSDIYTGVFSIHLETDTFVPVKVEESLNELLNGCASAQQAMFALMKKDVCQKDKLDMLEFVDLSTLSKRMGSQKCLSKEFKDILSGWVRAEFIEVSNDKNGKLTQVLFTYQIIDEEKKKELEENERLQQAVIAADSANRAKSAFLLNMNHDIRTPLNGIVGLLKINMAHSEDRELVSENQKKMEKAANHLLSLINDVLQMSKLEEGKEEFISEVVYLPSISHDIVAIIQGNAADKGITLKFNKVGNIMYPYVMTNPLHLRQIFLNIYGNSIKFTNEGGEILTNLECLQKKDNTIIYRWVISDTGVGMSEEFLQHIYEPFAQEKKDARSVYQGTGLGMAIVKKLIEGMGGTISIQSEIGKGSTFAIELPFEIAAEPDNQEIEECDIHGLNIMLVEDNNLNAEIAEMLLKDEGANVIKVTDGKQAVDLFDLNPEGTFDIILMDIMMPVMDGITATKEIRALNRPDAITIPIVAMTANAFKEDEQKCLKAGMNAHLPKPLDIQKVKNTIFEQTRK